MVEIKILFHHISQATVLHLQYIREFGHRMLWTKYIVISVENFICMGQSLFNSVCYFVVYAIREAAAKNLKKLVEKFGADWAQVRKWTLQFYAWIFHPQGSLLSSDGNISMLIQHGTGWKCLIEECLSI